jgi:adenosylcobinamide-GDP ribazoletransferase
MDGDGLAQAASYMPIFPLIGAAVGLLAGVVVRFLELVLPTLAAGCIGLGFLLLVNGVQHADGLLDFGDGVMFHGSLNEKLRIMRDPTTGAGGLCLGVVILLTTVLSIGTLPTSFIVLGLTASEAAAKFSMVLATAIGKSAHKGMNTIFVERMHQHRGLRLAFSYAIIVAISLFALKALGFVIVIGVTLTALVMVMISNRHFGGITGDVLGACHEISRTISLLLILVFAK